MNWRSIAEWIGFQFVWIISALGAAQGRTAPGVGAAAMLIAVVLVMKRREVMSESLIIITSGLMGFAVETALVTTGLVNFATPWPSSQLAPFWIVALWLAFGTTLSTMASWLGNQFVVKSSVAGAVAGPLAYWAGERLGALEILNPRPNTFLIIALTWAVVLPVLLRIQRTLERRI